ncbi:hypothetical protein GCM10009785_26590 [Brooklawnia cerclae]|uniref:Uncharacterized protein n=1 Tax=Brooklawnia cerclae TaxID=349934 RepID=A0ABX0SG09_9ACTN|nr:hypothetical protein [Brooklawnia cerclae]NIH57335.1 hypothetical protein [Brooklawnia cerclae]
MTTEEALAEYDAYRASLQGRQGWAFRLGAKRDELAEQAPGIREALRVRADAELARH